MSEKTFAKKMGAKLVKNSGRGKKKGDMLLEKHVIDLKEVSKSFTLNRRVWDKIVFDASSYGWDYVPVLIVDFKDDGPTLVIMDIEDSEFERQ